MLRAAVSSINWLGLLTLALALLLWEGLAAVGILRFEFFPPPSAIVLGLLKVFSSGELATQSYHTLKSVLAGWAIAMAIGISLAAATRALLKSTHTSIRAVTAPGSRRARRARRTSGGQVKHKKFTESK